jgi:SAM-dependent methyltransferase
MVFSLESVVPWGRSFEEYVAMFSLTDVDLAGKVLGCGDGPAAFNAALTQRGGQVVSIDPIYQFSVEEIRTRIEKTFDTVLNQVQQNEAAFIWNRIGSVEQLGRIRMAAMEQFLQDYPVGLADQRYRYGTLPDLPFPDRRFDLALCSHFLFLYSDHLPLDLHLKSLRAMMRVASEVRIFPVVTLAGARSPFLEPTIADAHQAGFKTSVELVNYEFQRGGNEMLRITRPDSGGG